MAQGGLRGLAYVGVGVALFATSPVLVRWASPLSPFEITFGRMAIAALVVGAMGVWHRRRAALRQKPAAGLPAPGPRFLLYGLAAALHFLLYIASLGYTTIAHSLALVYTAPVFVTLFAGLLLGEPLRRRQWLGLPVVLLGIGVLAGFEPRLDARMALGDGLALGSALCFGLYSVAGRRERAAYPLLQYAGAVYLAAAGWLAPAALLGASGAFSWSAVAAVVALGVFPLAIGHTLYNASLRRVHPTYVNLVATQEVTGGILLGWLLLGEAPGATSLLGAGLSMAGVALVLRL